MSDLDIDETWAPTDSRWELYPSFADRFPSMARLRPADDERTRLWNLDGVSWHDAPIPKRWHRCSPQTYGVVNWFSIVERCACGAIRLDGRGWGERNTRVPRANSERG